VFSYQFASPAERNDADSAPHVPRSVVVNPYFDWGADRPPGTPYHESVIYEAHVRGLTRMHPAVPGAEGGTYLGMSHPAVIEHLQGLGVTAVELMPVHQFVTDAFLAERGLANYWGYNTIGFFAPHNGYAFAGTGGEQVQEFKSMVRALHEAGIEVILDVVYNHTAEGSHLGPTLSFRGIDNAAYYRLVDADLQHYYDTTGTGNSLLMRHPHVLQLIMDSLRYWVTEMHVDGFRFDLAAALARQFHEVDRLSAFFDLVQQDPVVSQVKLIAEPWDVGEGGYQVGNFPPLWSEWNGKYRDTVRDFWRGETALPEFASRLSGSSDLYETSGRRPVASVNFATCHDGFTLADLVSYNGKHNEANGEGGRDGSDDNRSWNCGTEGPTGDPGSASCGPGSGATSWPRCSARRACRCCWPATSWGGRSAATTTPTARTTRSPGWTGRWRRTRPGCSASPVRWPPCAASTRCSGAAGSSAATVTVTGTWRTSPGSRRPAGRWATGTGTRPPPGP
jgi:glycogen operon protein